MARETKVVLFDMWSQKPLSFKNFCDVCGLAQREGPIALEYEKVTTASVGESWFCTAYNACLKMRKGNDPLAEACWLCGTLRKEKDVEESTRALQEAEYLLEAPRCVSQSKVFSKLRIENDSPGSSLNERYRSLVRCRRRRQGQGGAPIL